MRRIQIVPKKSLNLYGAMIAKEIQLAKKNQGTLHRSGRKIKDRAKWSHSSYKGWINLQRGLGNIVEAELLSTAKRDSEWQLLQSFLGFIDRHFSDKVQNVSIQYE